MTSLYSAIIKAGLIAGTLDILAAITSYYLRSGKGPEGVFRFIASGAFGREAFTGGAEYIIAGILFHYLIAFGYAILFFVIYPKIKHWVSSYIIVTGLLYGFIAWCLMNLVIVPVSKTPALPFDLQQMIIGMSFILFLIGLPIALVTKKHYQ